MAADLHPAAGESAHSLRDWSSDLVLRALQELEEPVGSFVRAFPGRAALAEERNWLENWFVDLAERFRNGEGPDLKQIVASAVGEGDLSLLAKEPVDSTLRLMALQPHWFRGFREVAEPIRFDSDLIVIEGRNSSGKTSISEAIEWVFTGHLSRRTSGQQGHPTELADCIANEFRPPGETTSVELTVAVDGNRLVIKRLLRKDYSAVASDSPESELLVNGEPVTKEAAHGLLERLLAGVHPILMQHNLRRFVHDNPSSRREYFERLLQVDELTALVEKAVMGKKRSKEIPNPTGGTGLAALRDLANEAQNNRGTDGAKAAKGLLKIESAAPEDVPAHMADRLVALADQFLGAEVGDASGIPGYRARIEEAQRRQRESRLPLLTTLEAARERPAPRSTSLKAVVTELNEALATLETARIAAGRIKEAQQQIARATDQLIQAKLLDPQAQEDQPCPVCEDGVLTPGRVQEVISWGPLARAVEQASARRGTAAVKVVQEIDRLKRAVGSAAPEQVEQAGADKQLESLPARAAGLGREALASSARVREKAKEVVATAERVCARATAADATTEGVESAVAELEATLTAFAEPLTIHRQVVDSLQEAVGAASRDDARYRLREKWLKAASLAAAIAEDVEWEGAKAQASTALDGLRD